MDEKLTLVSRVEELTSRQVSQYRTENKKLEKENKRLISLMEIEEKELKLTVRELEDKLTKYEIELAKKDNLEKEGKHNPKLKEDDIETAKMTIKLLESPIKIKEFGKKKKKDLIKEKMIHQQKVIPPEDDLTDFSCNICFEEMELKDICWLENCDHKFCKTCMISFIKFGIDNSQLDFKCPVTECKLPIYFHHIKEILLGDIHGEKYIEKYDKLLLDRTLHKMDDIVYCPNEKCSIPCPRNGTEDMVNCSTCNLKFCFKCQQKWHSGFTCEAYQKWREQFKEYDGSFLDWVKGSDAKQCPSCKFWVQRIDGCDHMTCRCECEFCYECGGLYGSCDCEFCYECNKLYLLCDCEDEINFDDDYDSDY